MFVLRHSISDSTEVVLLDESGVLWQGPLGHYERSNECDDAEAAVLRSDLGRKGLHLVLGEPGTRAFVLELLPQPRQQVTNDLRQGRQPLYSA